MTTTQQAALLTDDEVAQRINLARTNLFDRAGTTSFRIARSIEQAILAKLQATHAEPVQEPPVPMFWVRLRSDGEYEGPIHNEAIEKVRKLSGAWHPLYLGAEPVQAGELPDERAAFERAMREKYDWQDHNFMRSDGYDYYARVSMGRMDRCPSARKPSCQPDQAESDQQDDLSIRSRKPLMMLTPEAVIKIWLARFDGASNDFAMNFASDLTAEFCRINGIGLEVKP